MLLADCFVSQKPEHRLLEPGLLADPPDAGDELVQAMSFDLELGSNTSTRDKIQEQSSCENTQKRKLPIGFQETSTFIIC